MAREARRGGAPSKSKFGLSNKSNQTLATLFFTVETLNTYYASVASAHPPVSKEDLNLIFKKPHAVQAKFSFEPMNLVAIQKGLDKAINSSTTSRTSDGLPLNYLKVISPAILPFLHHI